MSKPFRSLAVLGLALVAMSALAACGPAAAPAPTSVPPTSAPQVVEKTVVVEKLITATPAPATSAAPTPYPAVWKFGTVQSMTGWGAFWGKLQADAQQLAVDEINASGELPFKLEMIVGDHKTDDPVAGLAAVRQQINIDKVVWENSSWVETTKAINPICQENSVVETNAGGIGLGLVGVPWLHNTRLQPEQVLPYLVQYLNSDLKVKKLAMLWRNDGTGKGQAIASRLAANQAGVEIVFDEPYTGGEKDFRSLIAKIKAANPDGFVGAGMYGEDMGYFIKQVREAGLTIPVAGPDYSTALTDVAGDAAVGLIFGGDIWHPGLSNAFSQKFEKSYSQRFNVEPNKIDQFAANYYEVIYMMKEVLKYVVQKGGNPWDGAQLEKAIAEVRYFPTLLSDSPMELLPDGSAVKPMFIFRAEKGGTLTQLKEVDRPVTLQE